MRMWKNIKSLFIIEEDVPEASTDGPVAPSPVARVVENPSVSQSKGKVTEQFTEVLLRAMSEQDIEGFDYLEFKKSLNSLRQMEMDEMNSTSGSF